MRNIKLLLSYDGTDFSGWQRQVDRRTVQEELETVLGRLTGVVPATNASGRTDAGVHALGQVVHFLTASDSPPRVFVKACNAMLPDDVRVLDAEEMPQAFHSTLDARSKIYRYLIDNGRIPDPFLFRYADHIYKPLDAERMNRAAKALEGRHDFHSYETNWPNRTSSVRNVYRVEVKREGRIVSVEAEADGFLYNMVRTIVGTLVMVGTGRRPESFPGEALAAEDRSAAGKTAPPQGLYLASVRYDRVDSAESNEARPR